MKKLILTLTFTFATLTGWAQDMYNPEGRGFVHPGGLHTQADFDRIKQQIADGNERVVKAYNILKSANYAQPNTATYPTENIVRGGSSGENYMNACRGAAIAYQNALRWKIEGNTTCAKHAVEVLMSWARTTKGVTGDSNSALASGLYGYQFAQAAELMRDYEGWSAEDFATFKKWMMEVWYNHAISFLRTRWGTWENSGRWWQAPGHYWSNWGLCNALCVLTIGVLCDDVYVYNQALSFLKYDQCGTFRDPRTTDPILNNGLTEFWGNLIVTTQEWDKETGAYGKVGQMNESGRDIGHPAMAGGLAIDIAQMCYNQGNDMFAFMDHRLAAGMEYIAAQVLSVEGLPWTNYHYATNGLYYSDSRAWLMTEPCMGVQIRSGWQTLVSHYKGIKGVDMPFSEKVLAQAGIDGGGTGSTSGGYDQLGYTVLTHTIEGKATTEQIPTELTAVLMQGTGTNKYYQSELGGLTNTFTNSKNCGVKAGTKLTFCPELPEDEEDTGKWQWSTGETTKEIAITATESRLYRVTYTNKNGIESELCYSIAVAGDCQPTEASGYIVSGTENIPTTEIDVLYGGSVTMGISGKAGFETYEWALSTAPATIKATAKTYTLSSIKKDTEVIGTFINQGGARTPVHFFIKVHDLQPGINVNDSVGAWQTRRIVVEGDSVTLTAKPGTGRTSGTFNWTNLEGNAISGNSYTVISKSSIGTLIFGNIQNSDNIRLTYTKNETDYIIDYELLVKETTHQPFDTTETYYIRHRASGLYLTNPNQGKSKYLFLAEQEEDADSLVKQQWKIGYKQNTKGVCKYNIRSLVDSLYIYSTGRTYGILTNNFRFTRALGTNRVAIYSSNTTGSTSVYWTVNDGVLDFTTSKEFVDFDFELIPVEDFTDIEEMKNEELKMKNTSLIFNLNGQRVVTPQNRHIYIQNGKKRLY